MTTPATATAGSTAASPKYPVGSLTADEAIAATKTHGAAHTYARPKRPKGMRNERLASGSRTRKIRSAANSRMSAATYMNAWRIARLPYESAVSIAVTVQSITSAGLGAPVLASDCASRPGNQPSRLATNGMRDAYSSCPLKSDHIETIPATASKLPSHLPPSRSPSSGHPGSSFQTRESLVMPMPASTGNAYDASASTVSNPRAIG